MHPAVFFFWVIVVLAVGVTWVSMCISHFSDNPKTQDEAGRFFCAGILTLIFLGVIGWALQTYVGLEILPNIPCESR